MYKSLISSILLKHAIVSKWTKPHINAVKIILTAATCSYSDLCNPAQTSYSDLKIPIKKGATTLLLGECTVLSVAMLAFEITKML